jgi:hypothetical protein
MSPHDVGIERVRAQRLGAEHGHVPARRVGAERDRVQRIGEHRVLAERGALLTPLVDADPEPMRDLAERRSQVERERVAVREHRSIAVEPRGRVDEALPARRQREGGHDGDGRSARDPSRRPARGDPRGGAHDADLHDDQSGGQRRGGDLRARPGAHRLDAAAGRDEIPYEPVQVEAVERVHAAVRVEDELHGAERDDGRRPREHRHEAAASASCQPADGTLAEQREQGGGCQVPDRIRQVDGDHPRAADGVVERLRREELGADEEKQEDVRRQRERHHAERTGSRFPALVSIERPVPHRGDSRSPASRTA